MIGPRTSIGARPCRVLPETPAREPDGDGGYRETWTALDPPALFVAIVPMSAQDLERLGGGSIVSTATHLITGPYHPAITTQCRLRYLTRGVTRIFQVLGFSNRDERDADLEMYCVERVL